MDVKNNPPGQATPNLETSLFRPIEIYIRPGVMEEMASERADAGFVIAHALFNALLLNLGFALILFDFDPFALAFFAVCLAILGGWTFAAILAIEAITHFAAKASGGKGNFWNQLSITNMYLTPIFLVFFVVLFVVSLLPIEMDGLSLRLDLFAAILIVVKNGEKIKAVHKMKSTLAISAAYIISVALAYAVWIILFFLPIVLLLLVGE